MKNNIAIDLLAFIPIGAENAIPGKDLAVKLGVDVRTLRKFVHDARAAKHPILSDVNGYYWAAEESEKEAFRAQWAKRMRSNRETIAPVRRTA